MATLALVLSCRQLASSGPRRQFLCNSRQSDKPRRYLVPLVLLMSFDAIAGAERGRLPWYSHPVSRHGKMLAHQILALVLVVGYGIAALMRRRTIRG
jgi:hypothetical protein